MNVVSPQPPAADDPVARMLEASFHSFQDQCRQLCLQLFLGQTAPIRSLGFTSSIGGEGKTFLASVTATGLAADLHETIVLVECNWEHPTLHEYFGITATPGLAEWQCGKCAVEDIRHRVSPRLIVVPAGDGYVNAVRLLQRLRARALGELLAGPQELLIMDLPPIASAAYGVLAASLIEALLLVVRAGVTPASVVRDTWARLEGLPVRGVILNQMESKIPRTLRELL